MPTMTKGLWAAVAAAVAFVVVTLAWFQHHLDEGKRLGKLWADCQNTYTPACDEVKDINP